jgi:phytoene dehydrogenase-like protein
MLRVGLIPEPPPELEGQDIKVEYISILAQAQKMVGTIAIEQVCSFVTQLAAVDSSVLDKIDWDEAVETYAEMIGIPARILRSAEAVIVIREAKQEAELKMMQARAGMNAAEAAKSLSQAKIGQDDKGQNSALDTVIAALTGKPMPSNPAREAVASVR